jgi:virginiamycin B lyase
VRTRNRFSSRPLRLVVGIGALGLALLAPSAIAQAAVSGAVVEYAVPSPSTNGNARGITGGPHDNVWFVTGLGQLGRITRRGVITEFPIPTAQEITTSDGILWVTQPFTNQIGRINVEGRTPTVTEFSPPSPCNRRPPRFCMDGIAAGPDGNVWFTEPLKDAVGRVTPEGVITEFPLNAPPPPCTAMPCPPPPPGHSFPLRITAGADGNLWFALVGSNEIGRINPTDYSTSFFSIPDPNPSPDPNCGFGVNPGIAAGGDGNIWFAEESGCFDPTGTTFTATSDAIGRITTTGTVLTAYPIALGSNVQSLTPGSDANVWFAELGVSQVGRLTPTGQLTEYVTPTANSSPYDITSGPKGDIWFGERGYIGRIQPCLVDRLRGDDQTGNCDGNFDDG